MAQLNYSEGDIDMPNVLSNYRDFAYPTVKDRIPVILTKIVDQLYRMKADAKEKYGDVSMPSRWNHYLLMLFSDLFIHVNFQDIFFKAR